MHMASAKHVLQYTKIQNGISSYYALERMTSYKVIWMQAGEAIEIPVEKVDPLQSFNIGMRPYLLPATY